MSWSKIVDAVQVMCRNRDKISAVKRETADFYSFRYLTKQVWSVSKPYEDEVWVRFYPNAAQFDGTAEYVEYKVSDLESFDLLRASISPKLEARQAFEHLFATVQDKYYNVDDALDAILKSDRAIAG